MKKPVPPRSARSAATTALIAAAACLALAACDSGPSASSPKAAGDPAAGIERNVAYLEGLLAARAQAADALEALMQALPDRARLLEVVYDAGKVRAKGAAPSNDELAEYLSRLGDSPALSDPALGASVLKTVGGRESVEFALNAVAIAGPPATGESPDASPATRLAELEKDLPSPSGSSALLRDVQRLVADSGLKTTKYAPGTAIPGEFASAVPIALEVAGSLNEIEGLLRGLADLPGIWLVDKLTARAAQPDDPRSSFRAAISVRAHFKR